MPSECVMWAGPQTAKGYGVDRSEKPERLVHRLVYARHHGIQYSEVPGMVLHTCQTKLCIQPDHLYLGDAKEKQRAQIAAGKHYFPTDMDREVATLRRKELYARK